MSVPKISDKKLGAVAKEFLGWVRDKDALRTIFNATATPKEKAVLAPNIMSEEDCGRLLAEVDFNIYRERIVRGEWEPMHYDTPDLALAEAEVRAAVLTRAGEDITLKKYMRFAFDELFKKDMQVLNDNLAAAGFSHKLSSDHRTAYLAADPVSHGGAIAVVAEGFEKKGAPELAKLLGRAFTPIGRLG